LTQSILISKIEIKLINFLDFCFDLSYFFFCFFFDKKFDTIVIERKSRKFIKKEKETIVTINLINIESSKIVYFENIVVKVDFFRTLYFVVCSIA